MDFPVRPKLSKDKLGLTWQEREKFDAQFVDPETADYILTAIDSISLDLCEYAPGGDYTPTLKLSFTDEFERVEGLTITTVAPYYQYPFDTGVWHTLYEDSRYGNLSVYTNSVSKEYLLEEFARYDFIPLSVDGESVFGEATVRLYIEVLLEDSNGEFEWKEGAAVIFRSPNCEVDKGAKPRERTN